ncbi:UvrD-helicase domain-containing protein [Cumulibacter manganitolerans]|uniref:UvrD-helicase domain-containing protein n=1 Tax=Cumulibacter manganitolerans TaxID=1884992 RepID=UPI001298103F|nr:UvrD-helicase domain-containing protein [Cumulibacter manganitolerans]
MNRSLADDAARRRIACETNENLFVDAGAGSGKTRSLVNRVRTLALRDGVRLANIAAVTFTEKAGAELRDRLRGEFEAVWRNKDTSEPERRRAAEALEDLDSAAIGTLHSFAQRILTLHPIEAGLPPLLEVLDEVASSVAFEERWSVLQRELLDDPDMADKVALALSAGVKLDHLRSVTRAFGADWDLIEDRVLPGGPPALRPPDVVHLAEEAARLAARAAECRDDDDKFLPNLAELGKWGERLTAAADDRETYAALLAASTLKFLYGRRANWRDLDDVKTACRGLQSRATQAAAEFTEATLRPLAYWIAERVVRAARKRAAEGRLEFHDLLVLARELLRENRDVREALQQQFPLLLLDEFQDTDPIQIELAVRIAGGRDADAPDWRDIEVPEGSLFVVGDPKQSIYRFRRANIAVYLGVQKWFGQAAQVKLTTNFRAADPILRWVNDVFDHLIDYVPDAQPPYEPLDSDVFETGDGPAVAVLGADAHDYQAQGNADLLRTEEAADVAAVIRKAHAEGWTVHDAQTKEWRPLRLGDIAILIPARTSLDQLEEALDAAGISYRAESSSLVYQASEVHDLLLAARAVADPGDQFACVMALRSALFGCGDDDLWTWKHGGGRFNILAPIDEERRSHPVGQAIEYLRRLFYRSRWMTPSEVLGALIAERRMFEVAVDGPRVRDQWRRLRFVADQARAWSEVEHGGLRSYLVWAAKQGEESSRVAEAILPETDVDAVRIMTIHGAKGLEFPMVVLSGMTSQPRNPNGVQLLWKPDGYAVKLTKTVQTNDFKDVQPLDEQMDAYERRRLLYVAATRARDHLVVSLHRGQTKGDATTNAGLIAEAGGASAAGAVRLDDLAEAPSEATGAPTGATAPTAPPPDFETWLARLQSVRDTTRLAPSRSASGLEGTDPEVVLDENQVVIAGEHKGARDVELPPWRKGRYGDAIGRAVHGVLQIVDLATGEGLDDAVASQCLAEGVVDHADSVRALVQSALDSDVVRRAAARPHWRESYVGMVDDDGIVLEGFIDLIYREDDGTLVVVDYKTDRIPLAAIPARQAYYAPQLRAYHEALEVGAHVASEGRLLFLNAQDAGS